MIIYKITNKINGKVYIGQTIKTLERRWKQHCTRAKNKRYALCEAIKKYGKENFTVEQIDVACSRDELDTKEIYWIKFYDSMSPNGYNMTGGGKHCEVSDEVKQLLSKKNKGKRPSDKCILNSVMVRKGKVLSNSHIEKLRKTRVGEKNGMFGKKRPDLARANALKRKKIICVDTGEVFESIAFAAKKFNVTTTAISKCLNGVAKTSCGYHWRVADEK